MAPNLVHREGMMFFCPSIRSAFDLNNHTKATNVKLCAEKKLPEPRTEDVVELVLNKGPIGKSFKQGRI